MRAEVIAVGDELTSGQRLNTNSQWLSRRLGELGIDVLFHTTVADDLPSAESAFRLALDRVDIILATGGLGPTADDITRDAIAAATDTQLHTDTHVLTHIQQLFQSRGREMPERNRVQALFPDTAQPIPNPHGTAPGIAMEVARADRQPSRLFALPGVPAEMREMWTETVEQQLAALVGRAQVIRHRSIKCFGVGESQLESMLPDLIRRGRQPAVGITVHAATITLRVTASGGSAEQCDTAMQPTLQTIRECCGTLVFGEEEDELQHAVVRLLRERGKTLATAECGTSGRMAHWLSELPEAVDVFRGGMVAAADTSDAMVDCGKLLAENGARGCREQFAADFGLAIGPIQDGPAAGEEPRDFYFALATEDGVTVKSSSNAGHPAILKERAAKQALNLLRLTLLHKS